MSVNEKMTAIADAIRDKTKGTEPLTLDDMATEIPKVFDAGKKAEYDALWDNFQNYGDENGRDYYWAFSYDRWNDGNFNPKHNIICSTGSYNARNIFYDSPNISDTKVDIIVKGSSMQYCFYRATSLKTIRNLIVNENTQFNLAFGGCTALESVTFGGVIGQGDLDLSPCINLNKASIISVFNTLYSKAEGLSVKLSKTAVNREFGINVDDPSTYPEGSEYYNLRQSKKNWNINYA